MLWQLRPLSLVLTSPTYRSSPQMKEGVMNISLTGRSAVVTGSTAGIGRAIAEGLARAGASVVINGRSEDRVGAAVAEIKALFPGVEITGVVADVATKEGSAVLASKVPIADILINN